MKSETSQDQVNQNSKQINQKHSQKQQIINEPLKQNNKKANYIITKCLQQNKDFQKWYQKKNWRTFHSSHYDWWAFPINQISSHGQTYMIKNSEINIMKNSKQFMEALQSNAKIVCEAWGYDLIKGQKIKTEHNDQKWQNWPIRLYKMTKSLEIFEIQNLFKNAIKYGCMLIKQGNKFTYNKKELSKYFLEKQTILFSTKIQKAQIKIEIQKRLIQQKTNVKKDQQIVKSHQVKSKI